MRPRNFYALACAAALTLAACGGGGDNGGGSASDAGGNEPVSLLVPTGAFERNVTPLLEKFTADTGIAVEPIAMPAEDALPRQILDLTSRKGDIDLILLEDVGWLSQVVGQLEPIDDLAEENDFDASDFIPSMLDVFKVDGKQYAYPLRVSPRMLFYRVDLFEAAGIEQPPTTQQELYDDAEALTDGDVYGFTGPWGRASSDVPIWMEMALNNGGASLLNEANDKATFNDEGNLEALRLMVDLYEDGLMPQDSIEFAHDGALVAMQEGRAAMTVLPSTYLPLLNDPEKSEFSGQFKLAPMPADSGEPSYIATGWGFGLSKHTDNRENAWQLLQYLAEQFERPGDDALDEQLASPASEPALTHARMAELFPDGQVDLLREALAASRTRPPTAKWTEIESALHDIFQNAYLGKVTPEEALDQAEQQVNDILAD